MDLKDDPSNPSGAYAAMKDAWKTIDDILGGPRVIRDAGTLYLPKNPAETPAEYDRRRKSAPWQPEFEDILRGLAAKPFAKEVGLAEGASANIKLYAEDIDGRGNNLTTFAQPVFRSGIAKGMAAILVNNTGRGQARTVADAVAQGVRPYWIALQASDIIDLKTAFVGGRELPYHVRIAESRVERQGYSEVTVSRIRELNREPSLDDRGEIVALGPPTWRIWEASDEAGSTQKTWVEVGSGAFSPLTEIPLAMFWAGDREGSQYVSQPLYSIADKQIELYQALSRNAETFHAVGFPMLAANGMAQDPANVVETGPNRILYASAPNASFEIIAPEADALRVLLEEVEARVQAIRRLGMQPTTQRSGTITATQVAVDGARAHSALESWANSFKDMLEQAFVYTSKWLGEPSNVELDWTLDFLAGIADQPSLDALNKARVAKDISRPAYIQGLKRFGVLPSDFDAEEDEQLIAEEMQGLEPEETEPPIAA